MRFLSTHWESLVAAGLFLLCVYSAVVLICGHELGWAGFALFCAAGFFQSLSCFTDDTNAAVRQRIARLKQWAEDLEG